jgi:hypothetical protein
MYMKQMVLFTLVMQHSALTSFVMPQGRFNIWSNLGWPADVKMIEGLWMKPLGDLCEYHVM